ncbi:DUF397 domain-containing protein [Saccharothrix hoggarensis]|uniref:DUF397 domain-containing protein n=1 Tax=Saccharothrix hoggarensis TaxID=913853 RepID=A0ABW3QVI4_9PSEU
MQQRKTSEFAEHAPQGLVWRKSSSSGGGNPDCIELARSTDLAFVRNSRNPAGAYLKFPIDHWQIFLSTVKSGPPGQHPC